MEREFFSAAIHAQFSVHPLCALVGPRQVGKTTLARMYAEKYFSQDVLFLDLEDPRDLARLENPLLALESSNQSLIVIDEVQRRPELFPVLRVLVDRPQNHQKILLLGSASPELLRQSSETLAGRIGYIELTPFSLYEVKKSQQLWVRGGFPRSYLASSDSDSALWRQSYIATFLERDIPNLGFSIPPMQLRRFWMMLAHYHGQVFNASEIGRSLGLSAHTIRKYVDILAGTFMVRILQPWLENVKKRQVKSPKVYFRDSGILNSLLGMRTFDDLQTHPRLGSFWEGFALEEVIRACHASQEECYFWATHADAELDLLMVKGSQRIGFEFKYTESPRITKSMRIALHDLKLTHIGVIYPGSSIFPLDEDITAYGLETLASGEFFSSISHVMERASLHRLN